MLIIIVDGSNEGDPCREYVKSIASERTSCLLINYNIGHGKGMDLALSKCKTPYALLFDSDIEMLKSPLEGMLAMMEPETYGVGLIEQSGLDGYEYGAHGAHQGQPSMNYLHPFFQLISVDNYRKHHPYVHHGAPCYLAALDLFKKGLSHTVKQFPGIHHTGGMGWNWKPMPSEYVKHETYGTRRARVHKGLEEIEQNWVLKSMGDL